MTSLADRMKDYEQITRTTLPRRSYCILRVDGRNFSSFTRGLDKPFDATFGDAMVAAAKRLFREVSGAKVAYVQSDEISVVFTDFDRLDTQPWFGGDVMKMCSIAAATATAHFIDYWLDRQDFPNSVPTFDARVFTVPTVHETINYLVHRQRDAVRNSVSMAGRAVFSHAVLHGKKTDEVRQMLEDAGQPWEGHDTHFKQGTTMWRDSIKVGEWMAVPVTHTDNSGLPVFGEPTHMADQMRTQVVSDAEVRFQVNDIWTQMIGDRDVLLGRSR